MAFLSLRNEIAEAFCSMDPLLPSVGFASFFEDSVSPVQPGTVRFKLPSEIIHRLVVNVVRGVLKLTAERLHISFKSTQKDFECGLSKI